MASLMRRVPALILLMGPMFAMLPGCGESAEGTVPGGSDTAASAPPGGCASEPVDAEPVNAGPVNAEPNQIAIDNFKYVPDTLTVPAGTKVTWTNHDDMPHTVTSDTTPRTLDSEALDTDDQFSYVFAEPGTYTYMCTVHPKMSGQIIVEKR